MIELEDFKLSEGMKRVVSQMSERLWHDIIHNDESRGGRLVLITGEQGCGKTTLMRRIAEELLKQDTIIIWRGRNVEQIHWIPDWKKRCIFWHWEGDFFEAYDVRGRARIPIKDLQTKEYSNAVDLIEKLEFGKINVVYEPKTFYFSNELNLLDVVRKATGLKIAKRIEKEPQEGVLFWFELAYALITRMDTYWYGLFLDEVDDVIPENPKGLRWKLQEWFKNSVRDLRKKRVNFIASTHSLADVDWRIKSKIQFFVYMRNAKVHSDSPVKQEYVNQLPIGAFIMEHGAFFGYGWVAPYKKPDMGDLMIVLRTKEEYKNEED